MPQTIEEKLDRLFNSRTRLFEDDGDDVESDDDFRFGDEPDEEEWDQSGASEVGDR